MDYILGHDFSLLGYPVWLGILVRQDTNKASPLGIWNISHEVFVDVGGSDGSL